MIWVYNCVTSYAQYVMYIFVDLGIGDPVYCVGFRVLMCMEGLENLMDPVGWL